MTYPINQWLNSVTWQLRKSPKGSHYCAAIVRSSTPLASSPYSIFYPSDPYYHKSSKSSSSSQPPFRRETTIFFSSLLSATAFSSSLSCSSVTFCRSCPVRASVMSRFSMSVARDSLTSLMRPRRSAASGRRIWLRTVWRASASG